MSVCLCVSFCLSDCLPVWFLFYIYHIQDTKWWANKHCTVVQFLFCAHFRLSQIYRFTTLVYCAVVFSEYVRSFWTICFKFALPQQCSRCSGARFIGPPLRTLYDSSAVTMLTVSKAFVCDMRTMMNDQSWFSG